MSTWNRKELKEKAKLRLKANYWKAVLVGLITLLLGGAASSSYKFSSAGSSAEASGAAGSPVWGNIPHIPLAGIIAIGIFVVVFMLIAVAIGLLLKAMFFNPLEIGQNRFFYRDLEEKAEVKEDLTKNSSSYRSLPLVAPVKKLLLEKKKKGIAFGIHP